MTSWLERCFTGSCPNQHSAATLIHVIDSMVAAGPRGSRPRNGAAAGGSASLGMESDPLGRRRVSRARKTAGVTWTRRGSRGEIDVGWHVVKNYSSRGRAWRGYRFGVLGARGGVKAARERGTNNGPARVSQAGWCLAIRDQRKSAAETPWRCPRRAFVLAFFGCRNSPTNVDLQNPGDTRRLWVGQLSQSYREEG